MEDDVCMTCGQDEVECFCYLCKECGSPDDIEHNDCCAKCNKDYEDYIDTIRTRN